MIELKLKANGISRGSRKEIRSENRVALARKKQFILFAASIAFISYTRYDRTGRVMQVVVLCIYGGLIPYLHNHM